LGDLAWNSLRKELVECGIERSSRLNHLRPCRCD
jgi:hypothetical protein